MASFRAPLVGRAAELAQFAGDGFAARTLAETDSLRVLVAGLEDGQQIPVHAPSSDLVMVIVEGSGEVVAGGARSFVRAGDVVIVPVGESRGLRASGGRLVAVNVVSPVPEASAHAPQPFDWGADEAAFDVGGVILDEHAHLMTRLEEIPALAAQIPTLAESELQERLAETARFLREGLLPHAHEEELSVYPAAEKVLRAVGGATQTMSQDHLFISALVDELDRVRLAAPGPELREQLRGLLYGLYQVLKLHFQKENAVYVPLLARLFPEERRALYQRLKGQ